MGNKTKSNKGAAVATSPKDPNSRPHKPNELQIPFITAVTTYWAYGIMIFFGHVRDAFRRCKPKKSEPVEAGYAPLLRDFEDFFTRRMFARVQDCWNRPIASCPGAWVDLMDRKRAPDGVARKPELQKTTTRVANIGSYNYLGFGDPDSPTKQQVYDALEQYSVGTCAPRASVGTTALHVELERTVARFIGKEDCIVFGMGFGTNAGAVPGLVGKGGLIISDATNHASIVVGARSSGAVVKVFRHNDTEDLEAVIRRAIVEGQPRTRRPWTKILIIIEGIYSMEGEMPPLAEIVRIKKKYGCYLYVDEAHSIGALGKGGRGICEESGVPPADVDILMGTFTKAFGSVGGYIAADKSLIEYVRHTNYGMICASPLSPPACQQVISALSIIMGEDGTDIGATKIRALNENSNYFRYKAREMGLDVLGDWGSPICPIVVYHPGRVTAFSREMLEHKVAIVVVGYPATPLLLSRSRFCISAAHTRADLDLILAALREVSWDIGIRFAPGSTASIDANVAVDAPPHVAALVAADPSKFASARPRSASTTQRSAAALNALKAANDDRKQ